MLLINILFNRKYMNRSLCSLLFCFASVLLVTSGCGTHSSTENLSENNKDSLSNRKDAFDIKALFQGEYISPDPGKIDKGSYYTDLVISRAEGNDSLKIAFSSAKVKAQICCSFTGFGYLKNDTLFVPLQNIGGISNTMMLITQNQQDGITKSINVSLADTSKGDLLTNFCCEGASLSGEYFPCDLSLFRTDTTIANQNTNVIQ